MSLIIVLHLDTNCREHFYKKVVNWQQSPVTWAILTCERYGQQQLKMRSGYLNVEKHCSLQIRKRGKTTDSTIDQWFNKWFTCSLTAQCVCVYVSQSVHVRKQPSNYMLCANIHTIPPPIHIPPLLPHHFLSVSDMITGVFQRKHCAFSQWLPLMNTH